MSYASQNNVFVPDFGPRILFLGSKSKRGLNSIKLYRKMKNKRKDGSLHVENSSDGYHIKHHSFITKIDSHFG